MSLRKTFIYLLLATYLTCLSPVVTAVPASALTLAESMYLKGKHFNEISNWPEAVKALDQAIKLNPRNAEAYLERAWTNMELKNYQASLHDCNKCRQLDEVYLLPFIIAGHCRKHLNEYEKAVENFSAFIEASPYTAQPYLDRAAVYDLMGRKDLAKIDRARASRNLSRLSEKLNYLATTYLITGPRLTEAKNQILRVDPYDRHNTMRRISLLGCSEQLKLSPQKRELLLLRSRLYRELGENEKAIADISQVINIPAAKGGHINWNLDQTLFDRAELYERIEDYDRAIADYKRILSIDDDSEDAYRKKGDCEMALKKYAEAAADYTLAIKHQLDPAAKYFELRAIAYEKMGKTDLATSDRKRVKEIKSKH